MMNEFKISDHVQRTLRVVDIKKHFFSRLVPFPFYHKHFARTGENLKFKRRIFIFCASGSDDSDDSDADSVIHKGTFFSSDHYRHLV